MPSVIKQIKALPPKSQVKLCLMMAVFSLLIGTLFLLEWRVYQEPNPERVVQLEGRLTSDAQVWKQDRRIVDFGVAPHGLYEDRQPVYAYKDVYQSTGLRRGATVALEVEHTAEGALVRKLSTHEGRVLFDANMERYIASTGNDSIVRTSVLTVFLVTLCLGHAFLTWRRYLKAPADVNSAT
ncbi:hypothetical protein [Pseudomonas sp. GZD-222]|uniref:hypothetical protein n=1 Tax=Pseudomonas sp. GZD-222 TaxID=3404805 RepID=UPI003BB7A6C4